MNFTIRDIINKSTEYLATAGFPAARLEAELLVGAAVKLDRLQLYVQFDRPLSEEELRTLREMLRGRAKENIPLAYLTGRKNFFGVDLSITRGVFIPRQETEELIELVATKIEQSPRNFLSIVDLCTGSGAIAVALATRFRHVQVAAIDISATALAAAKENITRFGLSDRVSIYQNDLWPIRQDRLFDVLCANPPYIPTGGIPQLAREILLYEPKLALDGGPDGLDFYRRIFLDLRKHVRPGGMIALEHGPDQAGALGHMARQAGLIKVEEHKDLSGRPRVLLAEVPSAPPNKESV